MTAEQQATASTRSPRRTGQNLLVLVVCIIAAVCGYLVIPDNRSSSRPLLEKTAPEAPIDVTARYQGFRGIFIGEGWWQQLPAPVASLNPPVGASCAQMWEWSRARGGIDRGWSDVEVTIRARKPVHLIILSARSHLLFSRPPTPHQTLLCVPGREPYMSGEYVLESSGITGFLVDRDVSIYDFRHTGGDGLSVNLGFGEIEKLPFRAFAHACDCTWRIEVDMLIDGRQHHLMLDDADSRKPFRTIAPPSTPGDPATNAVWCAPDGQGRLTSPDRRDCPIPVVYETLLY